MQYFSKARGVSVPPSLSPSQSSVSWSHLFVRITRHALVSLNCAICHRTVSAVGVVARANFRLAETKLVSRGKRRALLPSSFLISMFSRARDALLDVWHVYRPAWVRERPCVTVRDRACSFACNAPGIERDVPPREEQKYVNKSHEVDMRKMKRKGRKREEDGGFSNSYIAALYAHVTREMKTSLRRVQLARVGYA